jgi:thiamine pyrophosphokinase
MRAIIILNGDIRDYAFHRKIVKKDDFVICADGGAKHAQRLGLIPDLIMGDFDSVSEDELKKFHKSQKIKDTDQNHTDAEKAAAYALKHGASEVLFMGAFGNRIDHTLAVIASLKTFNVKAKIIDENNEIFAVKGSIEIRGTPGMIISFIPLENVSGLTLEGFKFPLTKSNIKMGSSRCISNQMLGNSASVKIKKGSLLCIKTRGH